MEGRYLGIDYGKKRTGLAVSDLTQTLAVPLETVPTEQLISFLDKYTAKEKVLGFVLGMPTRLNGTDTHTTAAVRALMEKLRVKFTSIPCYTIDERFTSKMALHSMIEAGTSKKDRRQKENIDKLSASIFLQDFLDYRLPGKK